jgi:hypothetical protein
MTKVVETEMTSCLKQALEAAQKVSNWSFLSQQLLSCTGIKTSSRGRSKGKQLVIFVSTTFVMYLAEHQHTTKFVGTKTTHCLPLKLHLELA